MSTIVSPRDPNDLVLRPPQFRLRTLFAAMTAVGMLLALMNAIGPLASFVLVFAICLAVCHAAGNAIGTTLRDRADGAAIDARDQIAREASRQARLSGRQRLGERTRLPRAATVVTSCGATLGALLADSLVVANWQQITPSAMALAVASSAVLGGFCGFLASSFLSVIGPAWQEAAREERPASPRRKAD